MSWYPNMIFCFGLLDAGLLMVGGLVVALYILFGWDPDKILERTGPALAVAIFSNIAAAIILGATRWLIS